MSQKKCEILYRLFYAAAKDKVIAKRFYNAFIRHVITQVEHRPLIFNQTPEECPFMTSDERRCLEYLSRMTEDDVLDIQGVRVNGARIILRAGVMARTYLETGDLPEVPEMSEPDKTSTDEAVTVRIVNGRPEGYLTAEEFAKKCGVQYTTPWQWEKRGKLQMLRIGQICWVKEDTPYPKRIPSH